MKNLKEWVMDLLPWYDKVAADIRFKRSEMLSSKAEYEAQRALAALSSYKRMNEIIWHDDKHNDRRASYR